MSTGGQQSSAPWRDRVAGVLVGAACGDALGVPYEFAAPLKAGEGPEMRGGGLGPYAPGEYSDDTQMAVCIAEVAATGVDLRSGAALDDIAARFVAWLADGATDVGAQTRAVLSSLPTGERSGLGASARAAAAERLAQVGQSAGNGSLMRTAPVALAHLDAPRALAEAAREVSALTHYDPLAGDACVLWCEGIRQAVLSGTFDGVRAGLELLPPQRRGDWAERLDEAERGDPWDFAPNGFVVTALQAAWAAIRRTPVDPSAPARHLVDATEAAVRAGDDTDTVAAIAGALLGARWGYSAVPEPWRESVHGWPGKRAADLAALATAIAAAWSRT